MRCAKKREVRRILRDWRKKGGEDERGTGEANRNIRSYVKKGGGKKIC